MEVLEVHSAALQWVEGVNLALMTYARCAKRHAKKNKVLNRPLILLNNNLFLKEDNKLLKLNLPQRKRLLKILSALYVSVSVLSLSWLLASISSVYNALKE